MRIYDYLVTAISYLKHRLKRNLIRYSYGLRGLKGLEIGGPSSFFSLKGYFPVYLFAAEIDGVNYSSTTIWEGNIQEGRNFKYHNKVGNQFIREASDLSGIKEDSYDFILSCHCLEHIANPLKALGAWRRVLRKNGTLVLVLPDKENTFDVNRPYTSMEHLLTDLNNDTGEDDSTHFQEVIEMQDISKVNSTGSKREIAEMVLNNAENRCVHHHVFSFEVVREMLDMSSFKVVYQQKALPFHLVTIALRKD